MLSYLFEKEIRLIGLHRSGVSSCLSFIWNHFSENGCFYLHNTDLSFVSRRDKQQNLDEMKEGIEKLGFNAGCIIGVENISLRSIAEKIKDDYSSYNTDKRRLLGFFDKKNFARKIYNVLVLRSPHNNLADLYKFPKRSYRYARGFRKSWIEYAKEWLGVTSYLENKILFNFDEWYKSEKYRKSISKELDLPYRNFKRWFESTGKEEMLIGKGNRQTGVVDCWRDSFPHKDMYYETLRDKEIRKYAKTIFDVDLEDK